jgi:hypothetical protein
MSQGRGYTVSSGLVAVTATTQTAVLLATAGSTVSADAIAIRPSVAAGTSPTFPASASVKFTLALTSGGVGTTTVTPHPTNRIDIPANSLWYTAWSTAPTIGSVLWEQNLALAAGADWGEVFAPGLERRLGGTGSADQWALFVALSAASTATDFEFSLDFIE